ncbi:hypothetical protein B0H10DRAFT_2191987 [Mycena sp. CBHHK59/15]|nr:hypothetical protein B0H10DRAFT_2191987 [Mycena sp. CBHHK59/15]
MCRPGLVHPASEAPALIQRAAESVDVLKQSGTLEAGQADILDKQIESLKDNTLPDLEIIAFPGYFTTITALEAGKKYVTVLVVLNHPLSRGTIHATSKDPLAHPAIDPEYFENDNDLENLVQHIKYVRSMSNTEPWKSGVVRELDPGPNCQTDEDIRNTIGTTSMLPLDKQGTETYCAPCTRYIKHGKGGKKNFEEHTRSLEHQKNVKMAAAAGTTAQITSFFPPKNRLPASIPTAPPVLPVASTSSAVIDIDDVEAASQSTLPTLDPRESLLGPLQVAISTLPSSVPLARTDDFLSTFATNLALSVLEGEDPWESFVHDQIDVASRPASVGNSQKRGVYTDTDYGYRGSVKSITPPADEELEAPLEKTGAKLIPQASRCSGQVFPVAEGKEPHLAYALGLHAARQLPWSVTFGENIILRSDNCSGHAQLSGVCTPCEKLLRNQTIKGMIERNADGFRPSTTYSHLTMREVQTLLRKKNKQINSLKLHALQVIPASCSRSGGRLPPSSRTDASGYLPSTRQSAILPQSHSPHHPKVKQWMRCSEISMPGSLLLIPLLPTVPWVRAIK